MLSKEQFLSKKPKPKKFELNDGEFVYVRSWTGLERAEFLDKNQNKGENSDAKHGVYINALIVAMTVVDEEGNKLFTESDVDEIQKVDNVVVEAVVAEALRLNGLAADSMEDAEKKSETIQSESSTTS